MMSGREGSLDVTRQQLPVPEESLVTIVPICLLLFVNTFTTGVVIRSSPPVLRSTLNGFYSIP